MLSTLLINNIEVGKIEVDDMSGVISPRLQTYMDSDDCTIVLEYYLLDFTKETVRIIYLYQEYDNEGYITEKSYEFNSEQIGNENWEKSYQLTILNN